MKKHYLSPGSISVVIAAMAAVIFFMIFNITPASAAPAGPTLMERLVNFWPFIISLTIFLLVILWYQNIRLNSRQGRGSRQVRGLNIILILGIVIILVLILLAIPWFTNRISEPARLQPTETIINAENRTELNLSVDGMTCTGCENIIEKRVGALPGVAFVSAGHIQGVASVVYDSTITDKSDIILAIEEAGYRVEDSPVNPLEMNPE